MPYNETMESPQASGSSELDGYSSWQIALWFVILFLGTMMAVCFRTSIIRHMRRHIHRDRQLTVRKLSSEELRIMFLDQTLQSYPWRIEEEAQRTTDHQEHQNLQEDGEKDGDDGTMADTLQTTQDPESQDVENGEILVSMNGSIRDGECSICLSHFREGDLVSKSNNPNCPHVFHRECVYQWLLQRYECPMCRKEFLIPPMVLQFRASNDGNNTDQVGAEDTAQATETSSSASTTESANSHRIGENNDSDEDNTPPA
ncbi:Zinc finger, C3HC4 type (RING finger) [Seminavis robusta]|uniref:Zinc finger, C3HC4 type (RING finger) n=1 Tax=Seminavis robusta TaxID=568900 RepID=A0A9N8DYW7_9STRA|nr:Zinc finger, C3HC4 type (RING finger) [Seminavis robusta]|eukprot:Sro352_g124190.1 Zinc finger, C3HC4 type (RING finger) (258) ;mRNA; r:29380-30153